MANKVIAFVEEHPIEVGVGVVAIGLLLLYMLGSGGSQQSGQSQAAAAYYAAQSADAQAGDAVQIAQINAQASTTQATAADTASVTNNSTWAATDLAETQANDTTQIALAPFSVEAAGIAALAGAAAAPPLTSTSSSSSNGFFGIGGGHSTATTMTPNPAAESAIAELEALLNGFHPGH